MKVAGRLRWRRHLRRRKLKQADESKRDMGRRVCVGAVLHSALQAGTHEAVRHVEVAPATDGRLCRRQRRWVWRQWRPLWRLPRRRPSGKTPVDADRQIARRARPWFAGDRGCSCAGATRSWLTSRSKLTIRCGLTSYRCWRFASGPRRQGASATTGSVTAPASGRPGHGSTPAPLPPGAALAHAIDVTGVTIICIVSSDYMGAFDLP
jgi:hypothetical protein